MLTISQSLPPNIGAQSRTWAGMFLSLLPSTLAGQNHRRSTALDNMPQGLLMFDAQGRIVLLNRRYIDMYKVSPKIVRPGCSLRELIAHRKQTGLFSGDVESYCRGILEVAAKGENTRAYVQASDGLTVLAKNEVMPGAARYPPMRTSPNNIPPSENALRSRPRRSGAPRSTGPLVLSARRWRSCCPA
jgi:PAS domain-containing protein